MKREAWWSLVLCGCLAAPVCGGTFGKAVSIGGHASDLVLDETRGELYVANFTANRIEALAVPDGTLKHSINVAPQPGSLALSPDGRYLLVTHYANYQTPGMPRNAITLLDLATGARQTFALSAPPLGAAFLINGRALIVTTTEFLSFEPVSGTVRLLDTVEGVTATTLPAPPANFPPQIIAASVAASRDQQVVYGLTDTIRFRYDLLSGRVVSLGYTAEPPLGPRVVSVSRDGAYYTAGWALFDRQGSVIAQFPGASGLLNVGSHAIDSDRGVIYAQIPAEEGAPPVLMIADADNLTVRERVQLPENLAGRSVLSSDGSMMYSASDSGVLILPVGNYSRARRLKTSSEEIFLRTGFCNRRVAVQGLWIEDESGATTDFTIASSHPAITVSPSYGTTPARVEVRADPNALQNRSGTAVAWLDIRSSGAVNLPSRVRVLASLLEPDQRGTVIHIPGRLVDILADPVRNRFYVLRQDRNEVLVFDAADYRRIAVLRTGNTPTQMAITADRRLLLVGNDNSQIANVYDLDTLVQTAPVRFPPGHYPRSLAAAAGAILAASRVAGPNHTIDRVDLLTRTASELPTLGVYENKVDLHTVLVASGNGSSILVAEADGSLMLYDANAATFTISRKDYTSLEGAYAASNSGMFVVDNLLLNSSLVPVGRFEKGANLSSGFAFDGDSGLLTLAPPGGGAGVMERVDLSSAAAVRPTRIAEAPPEREPGFALTRTLAPLANRQAIVSLTTAGFTVLSWNYDAATAPPRIDAVVNAADFGRPVAPGGLIAVFGEDLSPVNMATSEMPLPTALGDTCLTVNGAPVPMLFVSPGQVNAQLPFEAEGNVTLALHTPGGVSDNFPLSVSSTAPSLFHSGSAGPLVDIATVVRAENNQLATQANPVHGGDALVIYLTGLGRVWPAVPAGSAAPYDPLAQVVIPPAVTLGGTELPVLYAGLTPGCAGVYQINVRVPHWAPAGSKVPLTIDQGDSSTTVTVRVVQ